MTSRRGAIAIGVLVLWAVGLGMLTRREYFRPRMDRLAEAGLRINAYTSFFGVRENNRLVGYASEFVDTTESGILIRKYLVRETYTRRPRSTQRAKIEMTRTFRLKDFQWSVVTNTANLKTTGTVEGDSMVFSLSSNDKPPTTSIIPLGGPVLLPDLVPFAIALTERPKVGKRYSFSVFNPATQTVVEVKSRVLAESTFVIGDSAAFDTTSHLFRSVRDVPVLAWQIRSSPGGFNGWLDETGHVVRTAEMDADVMRSTYEEAFENWLQDVDRRRQGRAASDSLRREAEQLRPRKP
jgi:hypothetical protein